MTHRPTNRSDLLKLICDMREAGLPNPLAHPGFMPVLLTSKDCDELRRWLEGFWAGYAEGRAGVLEKLMADTHARRKDQRRCWVCGGPFIIRRRAPSHPRKPLPWPRPSGL